MSVIPTGRYALPLSICRNQLAATPTFRSLVSAADAEAALERIHVGYAEDPQTDDVGNVVSDPHPIPRAIMDLANIESEFNSTDGEWQNTTIDLVLEVPLPPELVTPTDRYFWWLGILGSLMDDFAESSNQAGTLTQPGIALDGYGLVKPKENNGDPMMVGCFKVQASGIP